MSHARFHLVPPLRTLGTRPAASIPAWRLIGGNNRDLGHAPVPYTDHESVVQAILHLRERISDAVPETFADGRTSAWAWTLRIDGVAVARSARSYLRHRECLYSLAHFTDSVPNAAVPGLVPPVRSGTECGPPQERS